MSKQNKNSLTPQRNCAECNTVEEQSGQFSRCSQCKLVYFCSKKCQIRNWKASHKFICIRRDPEEEPVCWFYINSHYY